VPPAFLNSREDAILLWLVAILGFVVCKDARVVGPSFWTLLRAICQPKLLALYLTALAYAAGIVVLAWRLGLWHSQAFKPTVYWFVGSVTVLIGSAVTTGARDASDFVSVIVRRTFAATVVIEFIVNLYAMPLAYEVVGVGLILLFGGVQVIAERDPQYASTRGFINGVIVTVGVVYLLYFFARLINDFGGFASRDTAEDFLVGPLLTITLLPLLIGLARFSRWEQARLRRRFLADV
jgi:hypothetical protein